jgi:hypothetical protein
MSSAIILVFILRLFILILLDYFPLLLNGEALKFSLNRRIGLIDCVDSLH